MDSCFYPTEIDRMIHMPGNPILKLFLKPSPKQSPPTTLRPQPLRPSPMVGQLRGRVNRSDR
jgi:hypothetical protein